MFFNPSPDLQQVRFRGDAKQMVEMNYTNLKNSIQSDKHEYHNACMDVWCVMRGITGK